MGAIASSREKLTSLIQEMVGVKSGLSINRSDLTKALNQSYPKIGSFGPFIRKPKKWWIGSENGIVSVPVHELFAIFILLLKKFGAIHDIKIPQELSYDFVKKNANYLGLSKKDHGSISHYSDQIDSYAVMIGRKTPNISNVIDSKVLNELKKLKGFKTLISEYIKRDILIEGQPIEVAWNGALSLSKLFKDPGLPKGKSEFFDQKFINYLNENEDKLKSIHWRNLELLSAEYFRRKGYSVKMTKPDGKGVDIYVRKQKGIVGPDLIVIQCKRYAKTRITIDQVKSFWSSVKDLYASKGLIVTTSKFQRGAKKYCYARRYSLSAFELNNVKKWIRSMVVKY